MKKKFFAAKELEVRVLHPSVAKFFIGQAKGEFEDMNTRHQRVGKSGWTPPDPSE